MSRIKRQISYCFRSSKSAAAWRRISSCLKSTGYRECDPMTAMQVALMGNVAEMA
ncbi:MAG: hypothetical protein OXH76_21955 [Boseongicola sp.]|nr:hypothetical protein [Boseongicola sp.]